jgi:hypothetical protein
MSRNKCFFPRFKYHMFYVLYPFVTYLLTLPHICSCHLYSTMWRDIYSTGSTKTHLPVHEIGKATKCCSNRYCSNADRIWKNFLLRLNEKDYHWIVYIITHEATEGQKWEGPNAEGRASKSVFWGGYELENRRFGIRFPEGRVLSPYHRIYSECRSSSWPSMQWVPGSLSARVKDRSEKLTIRLHLV